ncbi:MAG TPA: peptidase M13 [Bacteroidales bacterium]|nr:MAG: hypothetical protein A2X11_01670 [Bacteroidetes bacterium GWE2_42_24]OFY29727.1 MAG: hypothetical protein A2X09_01505 [Bacteroidetes bacterium GWF2_43_11]HAQ65148.1 peptidase M13 [Bacteroidales bacterium]HBZ65847.1 peptidase M13 [Bacteroidales bacterium]
MRKIIPLSLAVLLMAGCSQKNNQHASVKAIDTANMDLSVNPGDDFYRYVNGNWLKKNPVPDQYADYGAFTELAERNREMLKTLVLEVADGKSEKGTEAQKIGDFYASGMDSVARDKAGITPLKADLDKVATLTTPDRFARFLADLNIRGVYTTFIPFAMADVKNSGQVILNLYQGGLGLPEVEYYTVDDNQMKEIRAEYVKYVAKMLMFAGDDKAEAAKEAEAILELETKFARVSMTLLERRDPEANYNKMAVTDLKKLAPNFDWDTYFDAIGLKNLTEVNVHQPKFIEGVSKLLKEVPAATWQSFLRYNIIQTNSAYLNDTLYVETHNFYNVFLSGQKEMQPRWKRVLNSTSGSLGEAIGKVYVARYFPPEAKQRITDLVGNLKKSLAERISGLAWMGDSTKQKALEKLAAMQVKVGYPDKWIDYSTLDISRESYINNIWNANAFEFRRDIAKVGKPVDKAEWVMTPQTVNAGYVPSKNEIVFPAAILQPPFFYQDGDDAVNYGAIGVVIGHEMTHGFDDQGRKYDLKGNLTDWWKPTDAGQFVDRTSVLIEQWDNYVMLDSLHLNGQVTLGENIADNGGLTVSMNAFKKVLTGTEEKIDGFTPVQRFFLSYATIWRENVRDKKLARDIKEDVHAPGESRVNRAVFNIPEFYEAFPVKATERLFIPLESRASIW